MSLRGRLVCLFATGLLMAPAVPGQDAQPTDTAKEKAAREKEQKDKAAKAKAPVRSYSDDDLKKYKDQPKSEGTAASAAGETATEEPAPRTRRSREYGGFQEIPPSAPRTKGQDPARADTPPADEPKSAEEANWRSQAKQAHKPVEVAEGHIKELESQIADLRDQLNPMSTRYLLGSNSTAGPGAIYEVEEKIRALETQLADARTAAAEAEKGWQAFLEEARAAGVSPAWLNP